MVLEWEISDDNSDVPELRLIAERTILQVPSCLHSCSGLILLFFCWPLALLFLVLYPFIWLVLLPFRLLGIAVEGVLELVKAIIFLPARVLRGPRRAW